MSDNIYVKYPYLSAQEHQYFNWKCVVCNGKAQSPLKLEEQHMLYEESVHEDFNGDKWVKSDECMSPFHLHCATHEAEQKVSLSHFYFYFFHLQKVICTLLFSCEWVYFSVVIFPLTNIQFHLLYFAFHLLLYFVILFSYDAKKETSKVSMAPNQGQTRRDLR